MGWKTATLASGFLIFQSVLAAAQEARIGFTTYLRDGPGVNYQTIDEAFTDQAVRVLGCSAGWCHVAYESSDGYVSERTLVTTRPYQMLAGPRNCFLNRMAGYRGGSEMQFCTPAAPR